ncbi:MAG: hypothetical protein KJO35_07495 [Gammaproteobacteria bacterium]|nr:hypothetical protein [Gammaproteobacteria bacterium]NNF67037.1 hypothetical protein [Gammaproteobacteria bacterium]
MTTTRMIASLAILAGSLISAPSMATPLGLTLADQPDIVSIFIDTVYNAGTQSLTADGFASQLDYDSVLSPESISGGLFDLDATVDNAGNLIGGSISIFGTIANLGFNSGTLLTGALTAIGSDISGDGTLEFLFSVNGGDAAALFGDIGGIILAPTGFADAWDQDFSQMMTGRADTAAMAAPEPGILFLQGLGLLMLVMLRRRSIR